MTETLKALDTIGNCQRPVFSLGVSQHFKQKITNLWKFDLNWSLKFRDNKHLCRTKLCAFRCLISVPQNLILRSRNQIQIFSWKLLLSQKLRYFRGSRFSQCFILSTASHWLLQSKFFLNNCFVVSNYQSFSVITNRVQGFNQGPISKQLYLLSKHSVGHQSQQSKLNSILAGIFLLNNTFPCLESCCA